MRKLLWSSHTVSKLVLMGAFGAAFAGSVPPFDAGALAQTKSAPGITGKVSSKAEAIMEGAVVSAKRQASTIMVSVVTNEQGEHTFPGDRIESGVYEITMRAIGYVLKPTTTTVTVGTTDRLDLEVTKASYQQLALQMSNSEWLQSASRTPAQKVAMLRCLHCHGMQRPMFSKHNAEHMGLTVQRMTVHTANASRQG